MPESNKTTDIIHLSVVIPCYNEVKRIGKTLERMIEYLNQQPYGNEIRVINDGSDDGTEKVCQSFQGQHPRLYINNIFKNHGKGYAVQVGMLTAKGEYVLFSDADLSTPIEEVEKLFRALEKENADIAIGSRSLPDSQVIQHQPWYREMMGKTFNKFVQRWAVPGIIDTQCGFKLFKQSVVNQLFTRQKLWGFAFDVEILYIAKKLGYRIVEVPIRWENSPTSKVNPIVDSTRMLIELSRIRKYHTGLDKD